MVENLILVVEDSQDDELLTLRALRHLPATVAVKVARDGVEAAWMLGLGPTPNPTPEVPVLILLDVQMPRLGGLDLLMMIRNDPSTRQLPVIVFSSSNQIQDVERVHELGAEYKQKPIDYAEYVDTVQRLVKNAVQSILTVFATAL